MSSMSNEVPARASMRITYVHRQDPVRQMVATIHPVQRLWCVTRWKQMVVAKDWIGQCQHRHRLTPFSTIGSPRAKRTAISCPTKPAVSLSVSPHISRETLSSLQVWVESFRIDYDLSLRLIHRQNGLRSLIVMIESVCLSISHMSVLHWVK